MDRTDYFVFMSTVCFPGGEASSKQVMLTTSLIPSDMNENQKKKKKATKNMHSISQ